MKKFVVILLILAFMPAIVLAEEEQKSPWSLDTNFSYYSAYMFRGLTLYDGPTSQPSATINYDSGDYGVFHLNLWSHIPSESRNANGKFSEFDATFTYDYNFEGFTFSMGHISVDYADDKDVRYPETAEIFASVALDDSYFSPVLTAYHDYRAYDSQYYELLLSHTFESETLGEWFNLTPYVNVGFASNSEKYFYKNGFVQTTVGVSTDLSVGPLTVSPTINYTAVHEDIDKDRFWGGFTISYTFD